jgi:hypothetical protein
MSVVLVALVNSLTLGIRSLVDLICFIPYVLFQLPSSIIVRKLGPKTFLGGITFLWGVVMMARSSPSASCFSLMEIVFWVHS